jgi:hypothetical protein
VKNTDLPTLEKLGLVPSTLYPNPLAFSNQKPVIWFSIELQSIQKGNE